MTEIRQNRVKHKMQDGKPAVVTLSLDPNMIESLGATGFIDGVGVDPVALDALGRCFL